VELDVQIHDVQDEIQLIKIDLIFEQRVAMSRNFDEELVLQILSNLGILKSLLVVDCFEDEDVLLL
jgi:hypothetical protein